MRIISATYLARHTRDILDEVTHGREAIAIERNHVRLATLVPVQATMTARQLLAEFRPGLDPAQGNAWLQDSRTGGAEGWPNPWQGSPNPERS